MDFSIREELPQSNFKLYPMMIKSKLKYHFSFKNVQDMVKDLFDIDESYIDNSSIWNRTDVESFLKEYFEVSSPLHKKLATYFYAKESKQYIQTISLIFTLHLICNLKLKYKQTLLRIELIRSLLDNIADSFYLAMKDATKENLNMQDMPVYIQLGYKVINSLINDIEIYGASYDTNGYNLATKYFLTSNEKYKTPFNHDLQVHMDKYHKEQFLDDSYNKFKEESIEKSDSNKLFKVACDTNSKLNAILSIELANYKEMIDLDKTRLSEVKKDLNNKYKRDTLSEVVDKEFLAICEEKKQNFLQEIKLIMNSISREIFYQKYQQSEQYTYLLKEMKRKAYSLEKLIDDTIQIAIDQTKVSIDTIANIFDLKNQSEYFQECKEDLLLILTLYKSLVKSEKKLEQFYECNHPLSLIFNSMLNTYQNGYKREFYLEDLVIAIVNGYTLKYFVDSFNKKEFKVISQTMRLLKYDINTIESFEYFNHDSRQNYTYMFPYVFISIYLNLEFTRVQKFYKMIPKSKKAEYENKQFGEKLFNDLKKVLNKMLFFLSDLHKYS